MNPGESSSEPGVSKEEAPPPPPPPPPPLPPPESSRPPVQRRKRWKMQFRFLVVNPFPRLFSRSTVPPRKMTAGGQMVGSTGRYDDQHYSYAERKGASGRQTDMGRQRPDRPEERDSGSGLRPEREGKADAEAETRLRCPPVIQRICEEDCRTKSKRRTTDGSPEYLAYRKQVAAELVEKHSHSVGRDLLQLRQGRKGIVKQLQEIGYLNVSEIVEDADVIRGFDQLCRDVAKWRHEAIVTLRQRRGLLAEGSDAEKQLLQLQATRQCVDNYGKRIDRVLAARDKEIEGLKLELEMAKELCVKHQRRPIPSNDDSLSYQREVRARLFRGCLSSDADFWARKTAIFPELIVQKFRERMDSEARKMAAEKAAEAEKRKAKDDDDDESQLKRRVEFQRKLETNFVIEEELK